MDYNFSDDIRYILAALNLTQAELAKILGVEPVTISRQILGKNKPSDKLLEQVYHYAFSKKLQLNRLKEMFWRDDLPSAHLLLFHGAKSEIQEPLSAHIGRDNNDFGQGFYAGEKYEQAVSFVTGFDKSSVYYLDFNPAGLKCQRYGVDQDWMLTIAYYRGTLNQYKDYPLVKDLIHRSRNADYIIAPIADNRMFQIINSFIYGEITDEQCKHCLSATNLGMQYVFISDQAIHQVQLSERCYLSNGEKKYYQNKRTEESHLGDDKVKLARIKYRGQGQYIDEILERTEGT